MSDVERFSIALEAAIDQISTGFVEEAAALRSMQLAIRMARKVIATPPPKPVEDNAMGHVLSETLAQKHGMYPNEFRTVEGRQRVLEQIAIALIDARVDGKMINTTPGVHRFVEAYRDVEKLLSQGVDHG